MFPFPGLGLLALLRGLRSLGHSFKSFILRCLLFQPHILRNFRRIWSLYSRASPKDASKKQGGEARSSFPRASVCEGYSTICASRVSNRVDRPRSQLGPENTENLLPLAPPMTRSQSAPQVTASSHAPSSPLRSSPSFTNPHNADHIHSALPFIIHHDNTPLTTTQHSRVTSTQFAGAHLGHPPRTPSPSPSPSPSLPFPFPIPSRYRLPPSPSPALYPQHLPPQFSTQESSGQGSGQGSGDTRITDVPIPQDDQSSLRIIVSPPSGSQSTQDSSDIRGSEPYLASAQASARESVHGSPAGPGSRPATPSSGSGSDQALSRPPSPRPFTSGSRVSVVYIPVADTPGTLSDGRRPVTSSASQTFSRLPSPRPFFTSDSRVSVVHNPVADTPEIVSDGTMQAAPSSDQAFPRPPSLRPVTSGSNGRTRRIRLMHSEQVSRDVNKGDISPETSKYYRLHPVEVDIPQYLYAQCPEGWMPATHPWGALYFYNAKWRIFTDVYMYDANLSAEIHTFATLLDNELTNLGIQNSFPTNYALVLDIIETENETCWAYYYVDHDSKTLFWLHHYECQGTGSVLREVRSVGGPGHVKLRLESLYWVHWSLYPVDLEWHKFPTDAPDELLGALLSSGIDSLTSKVSTSPYTVAEMESMRDFIIEAKSLGTKNSHANTSVARLLSFYAHWRFLHFHGQKASRQDRYKSIYKGSRRNRTMLVRILSPILFFFPDVHLLELQKVWTDEIVVEALWREFMQKLVSEWAEFVLYSTVMLAANVAFLAIPGVIIPPPYPTPPGPNDPPSPKTWIKPSPAQIISSISLVFSVGSIITGLLLIRRNRTMMTKDPKSAWYYLHGMNWPIVGLEPLAIVFSLTYALLMWSAWGFFVALLIFSFQDTSMRIWIPVGTAAGIITILIVWCIGNTWDPEEREDKAVDWSDEPQVESQVGNGNQA
ncbi:hypothetical protein EDB83DRAFT_2553734 [Lactarius deliciosus]|nr:hypothetical protein EDB83DRAFT_2553734 [Lactarius deliciosus]